MKPILPNISTRPAQYACLLLDAADGDVSRALNLLTDEALRFGLSSHFMAMTTQSITRQAANACEPDVDDILDYWEEEDTTRAALDRAAKFDRKV